MLRIALIDTLSIPSLPKERKERNPLKLKCGRTNTPELTERNLWTLKLLEALEDLKSKSPRELTKLISTFKAAQTLFFLMSLTPSHLKSDH
jgi:hypothetical protein